MQLRDIVVIAHDIRSTHNVGSLLRTCEGFGITKVYLTGYTPYPLVPDDERLPHIAQKLSKQINKTALDAEFYVPWTHIETINECIHELHQQGYKLVALEQTTDSVALPEFAAPAKIALVIGREVEGIAAEVLKQCDSFVEIPMFGKKESFNVVQAAAMALYQLRFASV